MSKKIAGLPTLSRLHLLGGPVRMSDMPLHEAAARAFGYYKAPPYLARSAAQAMAHPPKGLPLKKDK